MLSLYAISKFQFYGTTASLWNDRKFMERPQVYGTTASLWNGHKFQTYGTATSFADMIYMISITLSLRSWRLRDPLKVSYSISRFSTI